jgi:hypothetical protein
MLTYDTRLTIILKQIISESITGLQIDISRGLLPSLDEYKFQAGKIRGLEMAVDAIDEAIHKLEKG